MTRARLLIGLLICVLPLHAQTPAPSSQPGKVTVTVVNSVTKQPVAGIHVILNSGIGPPFSDDTNLDGRVELVDIPPQQYSLNLQPPRGYTVAAKFTMKITVKEGESVQPATFMVIPHGSIEGTVTDESGKPIAGARLDALASFGDKQLSAWGIALADDSGQYKLANIPPGRVFVRVSFPSSQARNLQKGFVTTYYPNGTALEQAIRINVSPGTTVERIDFRLRPSDLFHVRGRVSGMIGKVDKPLVTIFPCATGPRDNNLLLDTSRLDDNGTFDFAKVSPGVYCVSFEQRGAPSPGEAQTAIALASETITVRDRDIEGINLAVRPFSELLGNITLEEGASLRGLNLFLYPAGHIVVPPVTAYIDATTGAIRFNRVLPAEYMLVISSPAGIYAKSVKLGGRDVAGETFNPRSETGPLSIQIAPARGGLRGKVNFGSAQPEGGIIVTAFPDGPLSNRIDLNRTTFTDSRGEFQFPPLAPGTYKVLALGALDYNVPDLPQFATLFRAPSVNVSDGAESNLDVRLVPASEVEEAKAKF